MIFFSVVWKMKSDKKIKHDDNGKGILMIRFFLAFTFVLMSGFSVFAQDNISSTQKKKVLLAYEQTEFKSALIKEMTAILKKDLIEPVVVEHSNGALDKEDPANYGAIFISNSGVNSQVRPWIVEWLNKNEKYSSVIILHTTQTRDWKVETVVDAVTSASLKKDVKKLAAKYVKMIKILLTSAKESPSSDE